MSPRGTAENSVGTIDIKRPSVVPAGLSDIICVTIPSDESLGYFQLSLRDKRLQQTTASADVPKLKVSLTCTETGTTLIAV
jgi:hypothetical protein